MNLEENKKLLEQLLSGFNKHKIDPVIQDTKFDWVRSQLKKNIQKIKDVINDINAVWASDSFIKQKVLEIQKLLDQIQKAGANAKEQGWFWSIVMFIPRLIKKTIIYIGKAITYIFSLDCVDYFKKDQEKQQEKLDELKKIQAIIANKKEQVQIINTQQVNEIGSRKRLLERIKNFEDQELPLLKDFLEKLEEYQRRSRG